LSIANLIALSASGASNVPISAAGLFFSLTTRHRAGGGEGFLRCTLGPVFNYRIPKQRVE